MGMMQWGDDVDGDCGKMGNRVFAWVMFTLPRPDFSCSPPKPLPLHPFHGLWSRMQTDGKARGLRNCQPVADPPSLSTFAHRTGVGLGWVGSRLAPKVVTHG